MGKYGQASAPAAKRYVGAQKMTNDDEQELHRLSDLLSDVDRQLEPLSPFREALARGALALHHVFIKGYRKEIENQYNTIGQPLTAQEREDLEKITTELNRENKKESPNQAL